MRAVTRFGIAVLGVLALVGAARAETVSLAGHLSAPGAVSWHPMTLHAGHRYRFTAAGEPETRLSLRVSLGGAVLKERQADSSEVRMSFQPPASGIYWLRVQATRGGGDYALAIEERL